MSYIQIVTVVQSTMAESFVRKTRFISSFLYKVRHNSQTGEN